MLRLTTTPRTKPASVPTVPIDAPVMKNTRMIAPRVAPMVRRIAMSWPLSFTSMVRPEMMLSAATSTISVRIRNMTLRSTSSAEKKVTLRCRQSVSSTWPVRGLLDRPAAARSTVVGIVEVDLDRARLVVEVEIEPAPPRTA